MHVEAALALVARERWRHARGLVAERDHGVVHAQRLGDARTHQLAPRGAVAQRQQLPEQRHAEVAVARLARRRDAREVDARERGPEHRQVEAAELLGQRGAAGDAVGHHGQAAGVGDELPQRDRGHGGRHALGMAGQQLAHAVVERHVAALHGLRQQQAGEDLGDGADLEHRLLRAGGRNGARHQRLGVVGDAVGGLVAAQHADHQRAALGAERGAGQHGGVAGERERCGRRCELRARRARQPGHEKPGCQPAAAPGGGQKPHRRNPRA
ncbi:hypothetical protein D3C87_1240920 [compost metagenome]